MDDKDVKEAALKQVPEEAYGMFFKFHEVGCLYFHYSGNHFGFLQFFR